MNMPIGYCTLRPVLPHRCSIFAVGRSGRCQISPLQSGVALGLERKELSSVSNVLTYGNVRALVEVVDEQIDRVASEQRKRLETIEKEIEDAKRALGRVWHAIKTSDIQLSDASDRIREHRERLDDAVADAKPSCLSAGLSWTTQKPLQPTPRT